MCGITGNFNLHSGQTVSEAMIDRMCQRIVHRGPDDQGIFVSGPIGLGMRRLSIIDLVTGSQPIFNEDRTICTVFNGEIYNFQELRADLIKRGHRFVTEGDTEVIVHLYEEYGIDFVKQLNGMFAIAIWDSPKKRLTLVRDRLGQKPLYYASGKEGLFFGSELKCLTVCDSIPREIDHEAVYHYFTLGYIPHPWSIYKAVRQLPPAGRLVADGHKRSIEVDRYWQLEGEIEETRSQEEVSEELLHLIEDSVKLRMISDVPLGAFLSGGLDSSIIVSQMSRYSSSPVKTFHIDFSEADYSEQKYARAVAQQFGTDHHELVVKPSAVDILDDLVRAFDEPFGDSSAVPTWYVSQLTRQHVTVALAGDGGDESFGGYSRYLRILGRRLLPSVPRLLLGACGQMIHQCLPRTAPGRRFFRSLGQNNHRHFVVGTGEYEAREFLSRQFLETLSGFSVYDAVSSTLGKNAGGDPLKPYTDFDLEYYLPDDINVKVDRMSMAHSLELRAPFLDYRIVELAYRMPTSWKIDRQVTKVILKDLFASRLPSEVTEQRKWGFALPMEHWLRGELRPVLEDALEDPIMHASGIFQMHELKALANEHWASARDWTGILWRYLFFRQWWHAHVQGGAAVHGSESAAC